MKFVLDHDIDYEILLGMLHCIMMHCEALLHRVIRLLSKIENEQICWNRRLSIQAVLHSQVMLNTDIAVRNPEASSTKLRPTENI